MDTWRIRKRCEAGTGEFSIYRNSAMVKIYKVFLIYRDSTFNVVVVIGIWNHLFEIIHGRGHENSGTARSM